MAYVGLESRGVSPAARVVSLQSPQSLERLKSLCGAQVQPSQYPRSSSIKSNVPHYDLSSVSLSDSQAVSELQDEWYQALSSGPGVVMLQNFFMDNEVIEKANTVFDKIIEGEASSAKGDHFAASGANSRVWNSFQKHAESEPASFVRYYSNPWLARISEAWLGPGYQMTTQLNVVRPGGKPQKAHRDYHLGFQSPAACARFPRSMHIASQFLTLQGGVAHSDVPVESGPTRLLPFSQLLEEGFLAWHSPEFTEFFNENWVAVPMKMGDAVFFNPALMHAAGENQTTDVHRSVNLIQASSPFGRTMESVNKVKMVRRCWEDLKVLSREDGAGARISACINALGEGYPFPTNLDRRPPGPDGMAPTSEIDTVWEGLRADWSTDEVVTALERLRNGSSA